MKEFLVLLLCVFGISAVLWCAAGWFHCPMFGDHTMVLCYASGDGRDLERRVRAFRWLRGSGLAGGRLLIVDCGLTPEGLTAAQLLQRRRPWVDYCPRQALGDFLELTKDMI